MPSLQAGLVSGSFAVAARSLGLSATLLVVPAAASTWTVDDDGPADFTEIQAAIDAASPGDVILIQDGIYGSFALDKGLTLIAYGNAYAPGHSDVLDVPLQEVAVVDGLFAEELLVLRNPGTVVLSHVTLDHPLSQSTTVDPRIDVVDSADVRLFDLEVQGAFGVKVPSGGLGVRRSRVEVVESVVLGSHGPTIGCTALPGLPGILVGSGSFVHAARTDATGGEGVCVKGGIGGQGGAGGPGVLVEAGGVLFSAGQGNSGFRGGYGGLEKNASHCDGTGDPGVGAQVDGILIHSGTLFVGACDYFGEHCNFFGCASPTWGPGLLISHQPDDPDRPNDPTLGLSVVASAGGSVRLDLIAQRDASAVLLVGRHPIVVEDDNIEIELLVAPEAVIPLGSVGSGGTLTYDYSTDTLGPGDVRFAQVELTLPSGAIERTNSVPIVAR